MPHDPRLGTTIAHRAFRSFTHAAQAKSPVPEPRIALRLGSLKVFSMADFGAHGREDDTRVMDVIGEELVFVGETAVALFEGLGEIPMEERDGRDDACGGEVVDEADVEMEAFSLMGSWRRPLDRVTPDLESL